MKKVKTKIVLFFLVLNCVFLFAGADEVPNTLITENPEREVKTIKAPKNRESAKMSIKVNKVDIKKIKPISRSKRKNQTVYRIDNDKSSGIETKSVVDEKIVVAKDLETLERLTDKNLNIKTLKELITSRVLEKEGYKEIKVDTSEPVYIGIFRNGELRGVIQDANQPWIDTSTNPSGAYGYVQTLEYIELKEGETTFETSIKTRYKSGGNGYGDDPGRYLPDGFYDGYEKFMIYELIDKDGYPRLYDQLNSPPKPTQMKLIWEAPGNVATLLGIAPEDFWQGDLAVPKIYETQTFYNLNFNKFTADVKFKIDNINGNSTANFRNVQMKAPYRKEAYIGTVQVTAYGSDGNDNGQDSEGNEIPFFRHYSQLFLKLTKNEQTPQNIGKISDPATFQNMIDFLSGKELKHEVTVSNLEKVMILPKTLTSSLEFSLFKDMGSGVYAMENYWYVVAGGIISDAIWSMDPLRQIWMKTEYNANDDKITTYFKVEPNDINWSGKGTKNGEYLFQTELPELNLTGQTVQQFRDHKIVPVISNVYIQSTGAWRPSADINTRSINYPSGVATYHPVYEPRLDALFKNDTKTIPPAIIYIPVENAGTATYTDTVPYTISGKYPGSTSLLSKGLKVVPLVYDGGMINSNIQKYYGSDGGYPNFNVTLDSSKLGEGPDDNIKKVKIEDVKVEWDVSNGNRKISATVLQAPKKATPSYIPSPYVLPSHGANILTSIAGGIRFMVIPTNTAFIEPRVYFFHYPEEYLSATGDITITHRTKPHEITIDTYGKSGGQASYVDKGEYVITISDKSRGSQSATICVGSSPKEYKLDKYGITVRATSTTGSIINKIELVWDGVTASPAEGYNYEIKTKYELHALSDTASTQGKYADFVIYDKIGTISGKLYLKESGLSLVPGYDKIILPDMVQGETIDFNAVVGIKVGTTGMRVSGKLQSPTGAITLNGKAGAEENEKIFLTNMDARKHESGLFGNYEDEIHEYFSDERYFTIKGKAKTQSDTVPGEYRGEIWMNLEIEEYTSVPGFPIIPGIPPKIGGKK